MHVFRESISLSDTDSKERMSRLNMKQEFCREAKAFNGK